MNPRKHLPSSPLSTRHGDAGWQVPRGVTRGNWDYVRKHQIAENYDRFLQDDPLALADRQILDRYLPGIGAEESRSGPIVADFGCGNGRSLAPLLERGYRGVGVDLSIPMLSGFAQKTTNKISSEAGRLLLIQANLVELDGLADDSVDHGLSLFSTLGMIEKAKHRAEFMAHVRRIIRPGGHFILHAHNAWYQLRHPSGFRWMMSSWLGHWRGNTEFGDRTANYRGVNRLFIHSFRRRELQHAISNAGFETTKWFGVLPNQETAVESFPAGSSLRMVGWIVVCS